MRIKRIIVLGITTLSVVQPGLGGAVGAPFEHAYVAKTAYPDSLGSGTATADATASTSGALFADSYATADMPAGAVLQLGAYTSDIGIGGSEATAQAIVQQTFDVTAGSHTFSARFESVDASLTTNPATTSLNLFGYGTIGGAGQVTALIALYFYGCPRTEIYCPNGFGDFTFQWLVVNTGADGTFKGTVNLKKSFTTDRPGWAIVQAYFLTQVQATGEDAFARARVTGNVTSIDLT